MIVRNEIVIGWRDGLVTAGPFIGTHVVWTPEQAEQLADYLKAAAKEARKQKKTELRNCGGKDEPGSL